jgi:outer membrane protein assembly complex protein YaeT
MAKKGRPGGCALAAVSEKYPMRWCRIALAVVCLTVGSLPAEVAAQEQLIVRQLSFEGNRALSDLELAAAIATTRSSWFATAPVVRGIGLGEKRRFDEQEFRVDVERLRLFYRLHGYLEVQVDTLVRRTGQDAFITFRIVEGEPVRIRSLEITGLEGVPRGDRYLANLPLAVGQPLNRLLVTATGDTIADRLRDRGFPTATVFQERRDVDSAGRVADLRLRVAPGAPAVIGGIRVTGAEALDTAFVRSLVTTEIGRPYRFRDLVATQRSLYRTDLFRFVNIGIDTADFRPGDPVVPLHVQVSEGRFYRARATAGYGTIDCFRAGAGWTARNFFGNGRALDLQANVSKLGVGAPFAWGLEQHRLCGQLAEDSVGSRLANYVISATLRRPSFLSPENQVAMSVFSERRSEFQTYLREELGGSVTLTRESFRQIQMAVTYRLAYGGTEANDASFCAFFNACTAEDITRLREKRMLGTLSVSVARQRVNNLLNPTRGTLMNGEVTVSARALGSSSLTEFTRIVAEASAYHTLWRDVVLAGRVRGGLVVSPEVDLGGGAANFLLPEQRFYAGGADDVRGFARNELGPVVYVIQGSAIVGDSVPDEEVRVVPAGGNTLALANLELRFPSPVLGRQLRFAAYLDAGTLWDRGRPAAATPRLRFTPGVGFRAATPLGPARLDLAWNPYDIEPGTLFRTTPEGGLEVFREGYRKLDRGRGRLTWHFSVGYPF